MARPSNKYGDWNKVRRWINGTASKKTAERFDADMKKLGNAIADRVKHHITAQDLPWKPLSPITVDIKGHGIIYIDRKDYLNKINATVSPVSAEKINLTVAVKGRHYSGLSMQSLAKILEYGNKRIPSRPLWRPTFSEIKNLPELRDLMNLKPKFSFGG